MKQKIEITPLDMLFVDVVDPLLALSDAIGHHSGRLTRATERLPPSTPTDEDLVREATQANPALDNSLAKLKACFATLAKELGQDQTDLPARLLAAAKIGEWLLLFVNGTNPPSSKQQALLLARKIPPLEFVRLAAKQNNEKVTSTELKNRAALLTTERKRARRAEQNRVETLNEAMAALNRRFEK